MYADGSWPCDSPSFIAVYSDDDEKKTTGGRNGYGAKLANIFSTEFTVECLDTENEKKFTQVCPLKTDLPPPKIA